MLIIEGVSSFFCDVGTCMSSIDECRVRSQVPVSLGSCTQCSLVVLSAGVGLAILVVDSPLVVLDLQLLEVKDGDFELLFRLDTT